jgi:hypothetical protein
MDGRRSIHSFHFTPRPEYSAPVAPSHGYWRQRQDSHSRAATQVSQDPFPPAPYTQARQAAAAIRVTGWHHHYRAQNKKRPTRQRTSRWIPDAAYKLLRKMLERSSQLSPLSSQTTALGRATSPFVPKPRQGSGTERLVFLAPAWPVVPMHAWWSRLSIFCMSYRHDLMEEIWVRHVLACFQTIWNWRNGTADAEPRRPQLQCTDQVGEVVLPPPV